MSNNDKDAIIPHKRIIESVIIGNTFNGTTNNFTADISLEFQPTLMRVKAISWSNNATATKVMVIRSDLINNRKLAILSTDVSGTYHPDTVFDMRMKNVRGIYTFEMLNVGTQVNGTAPALVTPTGDLAIHLEFEK